MENIYNIKKQRLKDWQIKWLINNCDGNELILNRILRYPQKSLIIEKWCLNEICNNNYIKSRGSEYIGKCLEFGRLDFF